MIELNIYFFVAILGVIAIIIGTILISSAKNIRRRYTYPLLIFGGICLEIYSIYRKDTIFIILQLIFLASAIYGLIKINEKHRKVLKKGGKK